LAKLLAAGGDPTIRDYKHGKTALHVAAKKGCSLDIFKMLWVRYQSSLLHHQFLANFLFLKETNGDSQSR
jgi:hypothetical protein